MGAIKLETSRPVIVPTEDPKYLGEQWVWWDTLAPFEQGYIEPILREEAEWSGLGFRSFIRNRKPAFSDLAPEALAMIRQDCERFRAPVIVLDLAHGLKGGAVFWRDRQNGAWPDFPPLTPYLNDAGKVCLRDPAQQVSTPSSSGVEKIEEIGFRTSQPRPACPADCADHPTLNSDGEANPSGESGA